MENWPSVEGRYKIGNVSSPVAVCTNATVAGIELDMSKVALIGKCVTENIGIEKIIQNIVANSSIRFLILCGKKSKGHFVSQAFVSLKKNGIDKDKRIIGAKGNTPFLKGISEDLIDRFRQQVEMIDLTPETDPKVIMRHVDACLRQSEGSFSGESLKIEKVEEVQAQNTSEWITDPKGFFVVFVDKNQDRITVEHFQDNILSKKIVGQSADEICKTIARLGLIGDFEQTKEHSMYLAKELQKAELALKNDLEYEQDSDLIIIKIKEKPKEPVDEDGWFD